MTLINATFLLGSDSRKFVCSHSFQNDPLHSVAANPDWFAIASSSLQELQKFAYKFNAQFFLTKTAI